MNKETLKGWKQYRLNDLFIINPPKDNISNDTEVSFIAMKDVSDAGYLISSEVKRFEEVKNGYTYFKNDDVILAKITPCFENGKMAVLSNLTNNYGVGSTEFYVFRKRPNANILPQILYYIFKEPSFKKNAIMHMSGAAGQKRVQRKFLEYYPLSIPLTTAEQQEIVQVLDTMSDIIRLREECISHAQELIPALFQEMFGNPLKNKTPFKIGQFYNIGTGATPRRENESYYIGNNPWVKTTEVNNCYIEQTEEHISDEAISKTNCTLYEPNTIIMAMYGQGKTRGKVAYLKVSATTNQACAALQLKENYKDEINNIFVFYYLQFIYNYLRTLSQGGGRPNMNLSIVRNIPLYKPDIKLQNIFANKVLEIENYIKEQQEELENAKQMFQSLLHHAFTGELTRHKFGGDANG